MEKDDEDLEKDKPVVEKKKHLPVLRNFILLSAPIGIIFIGILLSWVIASSQPQVSKKEDSALGVEEVDVIKLKNETVATTIEGYGTVRSQRETKLTSGVTGRIVYIAESFKRGNFVKKDEVLIRISRQDYQIAYDLAEAELEESENELDRLKKTEDFLKREINILEEQMVLSRKDFERNRKLALSGKVSEKEWENTQSAYLQQQQVYLNTKKSVETLPHEMKRVQISIKRNQVNKKRVKNDLDKTEITAPFGGEVLAKDVEIDQFVSSGLELGHLAYDGVYEVFVRVDPEELQKIPYVPKENLPESMRTLEEAIGTPKAKVNWVAFGRSHTWEGTLVRIEPIDEKTRTLPLVIEVQDPWANLKKGSLPLLTGVYCEVTIEGVKVEKAMTVPERAIRERDTIYLLRDEKLHMENVYIYHTSDKYMIFPKDRERKDVVKEGDLVIISPIMYPIEGMKLRERKSPLEKQDSIKTPDEETKNE